MPQPDTATLESCVDTLFPQILAFREDLHRHPELGWEEKRTTEKIIEALNREGLTAITRPLETGAVLDMVFAEDAPFVLLRADIDALPITDQKVGVAYRSLNKGVCHACAHDVHTTVMLGAALAIQRSGLRPAYNLRFVFQPAEEPIPSGAPKMIAAGVMEKVAYALGLHMEPSLPVGQVTMASGFINMQSIRLDLRLHGPGGHSARPSETADLLWIASRIIQDSYQMVYRGVSHLTSTAILTFTEIEAVQGYNVIPNELRLTGTLRISDSAKKEVILQRFRQLLSTLEADNACRIELSVLEGSPAIHNHPELIENLHSRLMEDFWIPLEVIREHRTPGGDDFSHYSKRVPGAMLKFGSRAEGFNASVHEGLFDVPAEAIRIATAFFVHQLAGFRGITAEQPTR